MSVSQRVDTSPMRPLLAALVLIAFSGQGLAEQKCGFLGALTQSCIPTPEETRKFEKALSDLEKQFKADAKAAKDARRAEATVVLSNILTATGVQGFKMLQGAETPAALREGDAVWTAPGMVGALRIVSLGTATPKLEDLASTVMADDAKRCKGLFASGRYPTDPSGSARLMTGCSIATTKVETHYSIAPRGKGGFYVISVVGLNGGDKAAQQASAQLHATAVRMLSAR